MNADRYPLSETIGCLLMVGLACWVCIGVGVMLVAPGLLR